MSMWLCMHVCMYVCMYVCMHACVHACTYIYVCVAVSQSSLACACMKLVSDAGALVKMTQAEKQRLRELLDDPNSEGEEEEGEENRREEQENDQVCLTTERKSGMKYIFHRIQIIEYYSNF